jgi:nickel superoxide dismutase
MKARYIALLAVVLGVFASGNAWAHCEIPCGIYDDHMRIHMIEEHTTTIEKSMNQIVELSGQSPVNYNQLVRWVTNKEQHANELQEIVTQYFMTQRIKPDAKDYEKKVTVLHKMLLAAMNCKQTTDLANVRELRALTSEFEGMYFEGQ